MLFMDLVEKSVAVNNLVRNRIKCTSKCEIVYNDFIFNIMIKDINFNMSRRFTFYEMEVLSIERMYTIIHRNLLDEFKRFIEK